MTAATSMITRIVGLYRLFSMKKCYQQEVFALFFSAITVFLLVSFLFFDVTDSSPFSYSYPPSDLKNPGGKLGARITGILVYWLGFAGLTIPFLNLHFVYNILRGRGIGHLLVNVMTTTAMILSITIILDQFINLYSYQGYEFLGGGLIGARSRMLLMEWVGALGTGVFTLTLMLSAIMVQWRKGIFRDFIQLFKSINLRLPKISLRSKKVREKIDSKMIHGTMTEPDIGFLREEPVCVDISHDNSYHPAFEDRKVNHSYIPPRLSVFTKSDVPNETAASASELEKTSQLLVKTLEEFGIKGEIIGHQPGPVVTVYEFQPQAGIKQAKIISLIDDLALALHVDSLFIHPAKGKRALGIQVPNQKRQLVRFGDIINSKVFLEARSPLTFAMGKSLRGEPVCTDLQLMPHLLMAGATGSGKSVGINALLCSIIMKSSPQQVRMILVDPKMLELSVYDGIPHLLMPVITEPTRATMALKWAINEMERRYKMMQQVAVRNIDGFNDFWDKLGADQKRELRETLGDDSVEKLPFILIVIDELADLMLTAPKETEAMIQRLAQKARASGIHMTLATQRPSVDVITGVIKANLPSRISFQVVSKHDSRTILDQMGGEKLLGKGDMVFQRPGFPILERIQGAFVSDEEVIKLVAEVKANDTSNYDATMIQWIEEEARRATVDDSDLFTDSDSDLDPKWDESITIAQTHGVVSASFLQRHLKIGYNRAARIVDQMEKQSLVAKADGSKPRKWLGQQII